jgi:formylmethanofuran dehydrogenase subunit B
MGVVKASLKKESETNILQKITSGEFDMVLIAGDDALAHLPGPAAKALAKTQIIYVGPPGGLTDSKATISIHTADIMIAGSENMTRVDMQEIQFKKWEASKEVKSMSEVLQKMNELIRKKK